MTEHPRPAHTGRVGRPPIGGVTHVRLGETRKERLNEWAKAHDLKEADALREAVDLLLNWET